MITDDFTPRQRSMIEFYTNQYNQTTNQIQTLMDKQSDLTKLIRELTEYQHLLFSRQHELLRLLNEVYSVTHPQPNISSSVNQPIRTNSNSNISRFAESISQVPTRTTTSTSTSNPSTFDNYLVYTFLPNETTRATSRNSQPLTTTNLASSLIETFIDEFLNPVSTAPTNEQIQEATTSIMYRDIPTPVNTNCPISLNVFQQEDVVLQINRCRHNYTPSSLLEWFHSNNHCPLCRIDIRVMVENIE
jgi:hypothetical protein